MNHNLSAVLRTVLCVLLMAVVYVLQAVFSLRFSIFGVHIDLLPLLVAAAGLVMGPGTGLVCGLAAGILYDVSGTLTEGLYPIYYMISGIGCGLLAVRYRGRETRCVMLCSVGMITVLSLLRYLFYFQFMGDTGFLIFAWDMAVRALLAVVLSPLVLAVVRRIGGRKRRRSEHISTSPQA